MKNSEQYISIDKAMYVSKKTVYDNDGKPRTKKNTWKISFIDSYGFLQASLENLVENFPKEKFKMLGEEFKGEMFDLVLRKGVFPYEWFLITSENSTKRGFCPSEPSTPP